MWLSEISRSKSFGKVKIGLDDDDREPRRHRMEDFKMENDILHRSKFKVEL